MRVSSPRVLRTLAALLAWAFALKISTLDADAARTAALALWATSIALIAWPERRPQHSASWTRGEQLWCAAAVALAVATHAWRLDVYPFHLAGDPIRDCGLWPIALWETPRLSPFGWGPYKSMMMLAPSVIAPFYAAIGGTHFFQICGVVLAGVETLVMYRLALRVFGLRSAIVASLVLATLPAHLAYARTEVVIAMTSFWTTVLIALAVRADERPEDTWIPALGVFAGVAIAFHAGVRVMALVAGGWVLVRALRPWEWRRSVIHALRSVSIFLGAVLIGFGPCLLVVDRDLFGAQGKLVLGQRSFWDALSVYANAVLVYGWRTPEWYQMGLMRPILTPILIVPLLAGASMAFRRGAAPLSRLLVGILLVVPLTNAALTDAPISLHRIVAVFPALALLIGAGVGRVRRPFWLGSALAFVAVLGCAWHSWVFFGQAPLEIHSGGMTREMAFAYAHAVRAARDDARLRGSASLCWSVSVRQRDALALLHYRENLRFYLPHIRHDVVAVPEQADTTIDLSTVCPATSERPATAWNTLVRCTTPDRYACGGFGPFTVRVGP